MLVTLFGILTDVKLLQLEKQEPQISTVPSLIDIFVLLGMLPLYLYATLPTYMSPSFWSLYH